MVESSRNTSGIRCQMNWQSLFFFKKKNNNNNKIQPAVRSPSRLSSGLSAGGRQRGSGTGPAGALAGERHLGGAGSAPRAVGSCRGASLTGARECPAWGPVLLGPSLSRAPVLSQSWPEQPLTSVLQQRRPRRLRSRPPLPSPPPVAGESPTATEDFDLVRFRGGESPSDRNGHC